ncbi:unnamed protein product [Rotaria sp. Silwood2]|nr:unnamed protein product [Rotaria sp. Silwood2]CAF2525938.1 unnamed protein product [Rotaria sp. Silwood2]CAF2804190.1 unnamed protein product [Rotaria sp. Silwood2]CAF2949379.1 unnamed protein product [Rotaria sp. Silwood2]CAF3939502.1 unnamed protein product [Rotaria sp. Silwood2]
MSSQSDNEVHDPVANLHMQPSRGILKSKKSIDDAKQDIQPETIAPSLNNCPTTGMTRSESRSHKIPHFDEMNIIATYHPPDKDYGHMKIEEPKTPYAPNDMIDEEILPEVTNTGIDPLTLAQRLNQSTIPSPDPSQSRRSRVAQHRKQFVTHRKQHYNEFEIVRLRKKEIEDELRALEQEEQKATTTNASQEFDGEGKGSETISSSRSSVDSIKPILVHHHSRDSSTSSGHHHHVHVEADHDDEQTLTPEERERKKQFELKRKKHYNEFRVAHLVDQNDDEPDMTG